jgi:hypothetical protein
MVVKASIKQSKFFRRYVEIINVLFNLSNREMDVLALLLELDNDWHSDKFKNILDTSSRKYVMKETYVNKSNLSRYISIFKDKKIIVPVGDDGWEVNRSIMPIIKDDNIVITFNINIENNNE